MTRWTRRRFIKVGIAALVGGALLDSLWVERFFIATEEHFIGSATRERHSFKVLQISDLHLQRVHYALRGLARRIHEMRPDLIALTGDAIDRADKLHELDEFMKLLPHDIPKVAILGNWEYWGRVDIQQLSALYQRHNWTLLVNESQRFSLGGKTVAVTGLDDFVGGKADMAKALEGHTACDLHVVLNHCPGYSGQLVSITPDEVRLDLILSGHTHGGQISLFGWAPITPPGSGDFVKGWYDVGRVKMYVSRGIGTSVLPFRFMSRAEASLFYF
jgi:predicted MPP superfamily phosphohydrolase